MEYLTPKGVSTIRDMENRKSLVSLQVINISPIRNPDTGTIFLKMEMSDGEHSMDAVMQSDTSDLERFDVATISEYATVRKIKKLILEVKKYRVMQRVGSLIGKPEHMLFTFNDVTGAPREGPRPPPSNGAMLPAGSYVASAPNGAKTLNFGELLPRVGQSLTSDVEGMVFRVRPVSGISAKNGNPWRKLTFAMMEPRPRDGTEQRPFIAVDGFCSHMSEEEVAAIEPFAFYRIRGGMVTSPGQYTIGGALVSIGINKFFSMMKIEEPLMTDTSLCTLAGSIGSWPIGSHVSFCALIYSLGTTEGIVINNEPKEKYSLSVYGPIPPGANSSGIATVVMWNKGTKPSWGSENAYRLDMHMPVLAINAKVCQNKKTNCLEVTVDDLVLESDFSSGNDPEYAIDGNGNQVIRHPMPVWVRQEFDTIVRWHKEMEAADARGQSVTDGGDDLSDTERARKEYEDYLGKLAEEEDRRYEEAQRNQQLGN